MDTTTTTAGYLITPEQAAWTAEDWADHFEDSCYAFSVLRAANEETGLLCSEDLMRLLDHHNSNMRDFRGDVQAAEEAGHASLPMRHAGQVLTWLGY